MAKPLTVVFQGESVNLDLEKVDRSKLYGYVETEVVDEFGKRCELATLLGDGRTIAGKGGTANGYLTSSGEWVKKADLTAVDPAGKPMTPVKSSFDVPVTLNARATLDEYLEHNIHLVYQATPDEEHAALQKELAGGAIFTFPFSFRGGIEASPAFLMTAADGNLFLCVGARTALEFIGLKAPASLVPDPDAPADQDEDTLDFSMM